MFKRTPVGLLVLLFLSGCRLFEDTSQLRSEMPSGSAPLNAVILLSYTGENYLATSQIQSGLISVETCPQASVSMEPAQDPKPDEKKDDSKKDTPKAVTGYTYLFGRENDGKRTSTLVFIPTSQSSEATPLEPDQEYCIHVQDLKDAQGTLIAGTGSNPFRIRTQSAQSGERLFQFDTALDPSFDLQGETDAGKNAYVYSSLEIQGQEKDGHRVIHPKDLVLFFTGKPIHPQSLISASFACEEREKENKTENSDCQGWSRLEIESAALVESLKPDEDGWVRARFNQYALWRTYAADTQYYWRIGVKGSKSSQMFGVVPNVRFTADESVSKEPHDRNQKTFWKETLNRIYKETDVDLSLQESDGLYFIPITQN